MDAKNHEARSHIKILIVDDEPDIRTIIKKGLELEGYKVDEEADPRRVIPKYHPGHYDLVLLDIRMPGMSGFELFREIRKVDRKVKVCFITAFEMFYDEFRRVFPKIHVNCFIRKPATIAQLAKAIQDELARPPLEDDEPTLTPPRTKE